MTEEQVFSFAFTQVEGIGSVLGHRLWKEAGSATALFKGSDAWNSINTRLYRKINPQLQSHKLIEQAREVCSKAEEKGVTLIAISENTYPHRLRECPDAPLLLFSVGQTDKLNSHHVLSIVGTRHADHYGKEITAHLLRQLHEEVPDLIVISGLAYGIDITAHREALNLNIPTFAVLGHGLDRIYPHVHRSTAIAMHNQGGGLLTEFPMGSKPDRFNFVSRNRIVAGLSDATLVIQSSQRGGSLITAKLSLEYNRSVLAVPGRITDPLAEGCNQLIADNVAAPALSGEAIAKYIGWERMHNNSLQRKELKVKAQEQDLFTFSDPSTEAVMKYITANNGATVDELCLKLNMKVNDVSFELFNLETMGLILSAPGGIFIKKGV